MKANSASLQQNWKTYRISYRVLQSAGCLESLL